MTAGHPAEKHSSKLHPPRSPPLVRGSRQITLPSLSISPSRSPCRFSDPHPSLPAIKALLAVHWAALISYSVSGSLLFSLSFTHSLSLSPFPQYCKRAQSANRDLLTVKERRQGGLRGNEGGEGCNSERASITFVSCWRLGFFRLSLSRITNIKQQVCTSGFFTACLATSSNAGGPNVRLLVICGPNWTLVMLWYMNVSTGRLKLLK